MLVLTHVLVYFAIVSGDIKFPPWSWDTVADISFFQGCNSTATDDIAFNEENLNIISKYAIVCIEKCQGDNSTTNGPNSYYYEQYATAASKQLKAIKPDIHMMYYLNSKLDWPEFELYYKMLNYPQYYLRNISGGIVYTGGAHNFPNHTNMINFDMSQKNATRFWGQDCLNATNTEYWDSCNIDQVHCWMPSCYSGIQFNQYVLDNFNSTKYEAMQWLQNELNKTNNGPLYINNPFTIDNVNGFAVENLEINENGILELLNVSSTSNVDTLSIKVHHDSCGNYTNDVYVNPLSIYLLTVEKYMYFGCGDFINMPATNTWHQEYSYPLGQPLGKAIKNGNIWSRSFEKGTNVTFNTQTNTGNIQWAKSN